MSVVRADTPYQACTNFLQTPAYYGRQGAGALRPARRTLAEKGGVLTMEEGMALLSAVSQPFEDVTSDSDTQWSVMYNNATAKPWSARAATTKTRISHRSDAPRACVFSRPVLNCQTDSREKRGAFHDSVSERLQRGRAPAHPRGHGGGQPAPAARLWAGRHLASRARADSRAGRPSGRGRAPAHRRHQRQPPSR